MRISPLRASCTMTLTNPSRSHLSSSSCMARTIAAARGACYRVSESSPRHIAPRRSAEQGVELALNAFDVAVLRERELGHGQVACLFEQPAFAERELFLVLHA